MDRLDLIKTRIAHRATLRRDLLLILDDLEWAVGKIERLQPIVDKLPKTADGVHWVPGQDVDFYHPDECGSQDDVGIEDGRWVAWWWVIDRDSGGSTGRYYDIGDCYSTPKPRRPPEMPEEHYFVDDRSGCVAVRDRRTTDPDYQGLWPDTPGVVEFWSKKLQQVACPTCGHMSATWVDGIEVDEARNLARTMNAFEAARDGKAPA